MKARIALSLLVIGIALSMAACSRKAAAKVEAASTSAVEPIAVRVAVAETRNISRTISVTGSLLPDETVSLSAEVAGRLAEIRTDFGRTVRKGDIVAVLDQREANIQLERSRASLAQALARIGLDPKQEEVTPESTPSMRQARAQYEDAKFKFESASKLVKTGDIAQERFVEIEKQLRAREAAMEATRDDLRTQLASVQALRAEVRLAEKRLTDTVVRAPFDGAVTAKLVSPGQYMAVNTPMVTLVKTSPMRLRVDIPETSAMEVRVGTSLAFTTDAAPGLQFHAVVRELNPSLEAKSRSLTAEARLKESDSRLRPGMFVQVQLGLARDASAVMVPKEALYQIAGLTKVFAVRGGKAVEHRVSPGAEAGGWVEVPADKIRAGEQVATSKLPMLIDGAPVRAEAR